MSARQGLNDAALYELKDNLRVLVSIDIKGIWIEVLQQLDVPGVGFHTPLDALCRVPWVLPEPGLDLWGGGWSEHGVVPAGERQCHCFG